MSSTTVAVEPLLVADRLAKSFGERLAVDGVSLSVAGGEVLGLLGPNGAGKSTTMGMLTGLVAPDAGAVVIGGYSLGDEPRAARRRLGLVPQEIALYPDLTVAENVAFFGGLHGIRGQSLRDRIQSVLEAVQLDNRAGDAVHTLSGGMKRRLNFAVALVHEPSVLVLDEPTVGIDPQSRLALLDAIRHTAEGGAAVLLASHQMHEVQDICDRVAVMDHGRVLAEGTVEDLLGNIAARAEVVVEGTVDVQELAEVDVTLEPGGDRVMLRLQSDDDRTLVAELTRLLDRLSAGGRTVLEIRKHEPNLEQLFFGLTGRTLRD